MPFFYRLYNLTVSSDISFPDLPLVEQQVPDVKIQMGKVPEINKEDTFAVSSNRIIVQTSEFRLLISGGNSITYQLTCDVSPEYMRPYLIASGLGGILHQTEYQVLHGSAINYHGKAVIFCGESGMGKSNTAGGFLKKGFSLISDDMCPLTWKNGKPVLLNSFMSLKLWPLDIESIALESLDHHNWNDPEGKSRVITNYNTDESHFEVLAIYMLDSHKGNSLKLEPLQNSSKLRFLIQNTFRYAFIAKTIKAKEDFINYSKMSDFISISRVSRPEGLETREKLNKLINSDLENLIHP